MSKSILKMAYPASWWSANWREALPSGNGQVGISVYGGTYEETMMMTHTDLWWKSRTPEMPDVSDNLPEVRQLLLDEKPREASGIIRDALHAKGYDPRMGSPLPLGDIKFFTPANKAFKNYGRELDMESGEITVRWKDGDLALKRQVFVSRPDDMIVCKMTSDGTGQVLTDLQFDLHDMKDAMFQMENITIKVTEDMDAFLPKNLEVTSTMSADGNYMYYAAQNEDGTDFGAVAKVVAGDVKTATIAKASERITVSDDREILVYVKVFIRGDREVAWKKLAEELSSLDDNYDTMLERHKSVHGRLLNAASLDLFAENRDATNEVMLMESYSDDMPTALTEKMWLFGRYLLISSSKEGGNPCHLYGLWCGEYQGMWAFNMLNENVEMIYWHALSGNMPELLLALFDYYEGMMDDLRTNARNLYGCRGIYIPASTTPESGLLKLVLPHIIHWTGGAGWLAQHYYDYYLHTQDEIFLKERALPFMREAALFYEDFFIVGEDGCFISAPSNSPENTPGNYWNQRGMNDDKTSMETTINATMDFAIAKELLTNLIHGSKAVGMNGEDIDKWASMLKRIPAYELNEDGAVKEWMHKYFTDNYHHRHESHAYPVFPGIEVTRENDPKLFEGFVEAINKRLVIGLKEQSGWSLAHMANNYARMGDGDQALECLDIMSRSCVMKNLFTTHNDWRGMGIGVDFWWAPIQVDANMGWCSAINEMLMFSVPGKISILPSLPKKWPKGKVERLLARGAVEVSIAWDVLSGNVEVTLLSLKRDCDIDLLLPDMVSTVAGYEVEGQRINSVPLKAGVPLKLNMKMIQGQ